MKTKKVSEFLGRISLPSSRECVERQRGVKRQFFYSECNNLFSRKFFVV